jgi:hypothetical protein
VRTRSRERKWSGGTTREKEYGTRAKWIVGDHCEEKLNQRNRTEFSREREGKFEENTREERGGKLDRWNNGIRREEKLEAWTTKSKERNRQRQARVWRKN